MPSEIDIMVPANAEVQEQQPEKGYTPYPIYGVNALGRLIKVLALRRMTSGKDVEIYQTLPDGRVITCAELTKGGIILSRSNARVTYDNLRDDGRSWVINYTLENLVEEIEEEAKVIIDLNEPPIIENPNFKLRGINALGRLFKVLALKYLATGGEREIYYPDEDGKSRLQAIISPKGVIIPETGLRFRLKFIRDNGRIPAVDYLLEMIIKDAEDNGISFTECVLEKEQHRMRPTKLGEVFPK